MTRPVWLQFGVSGPLQSPGTTVFDLLTGHLDTLQQTERSVVAIKGWIGLAAGHTPTALDSLVLHYGFIVGPSTMVAADFPDLAADGIINPGWMYRQQIVGDVSGDGSKPVQIFNYNYEFDVRSKRSLQGVGVKTLWLVHRLSAGVTIGNASYTGQVLLAQKG